MNDLVTLLTTNSLSFSQEHTSAREDSPVAWIRESPRQAPLTDLSLREHQVFAALVSPAGEREETTANTSALAVPRSFAEPHSSNLRSGRILASLLFT